MRHAHVGDTDRADPPPRQQPLGCLDPELGLDEQLTPLFSVIAGWVEGMRRSSWVGRAWASVSPSNTLRRLGSVMGRSITPESARGKALVLGVLAVPPSAGLAVVR